MNVDEILGALNCDQDLLASQEALPPGDRNLKRVEVLREAIRRARTDPP